jgi:hypothetical protein
MVERRGGNWKAERGPPAGAANAVRLAVRSATHGDLKLVKLPAQA